jgi:hypothetical protein
MVRHHANRFTCPAIFASREGCAMTPVTAAKVKYGVWGLIGGAIIAMIIGFVWGGWTTTRTTTRLGDEAVLAARAAICVAQFMQQPNPQEKLQELAKVYSYDRTNIITKGGWDKMPGEEQGNFAVARACADGLEVLMKK